jgi:peptide/nickel transport system permease protein
VLSIVASVPLAVTAAQRQNGWLDRAIFLMSSLALAMPTFYTGLLLILIFAIGLRWAPVAGWSAFPDNLHYLWLPAITLATVVVPVLARVLRDSISSTLQEEFVELAIVRGSPRHELILHYLLRPSVAPVIGLTAYITGQLLGSAVLVEAIFGLPGLGTALADAVRSRDYPAVQGIVAVIGVLVVCISYLADGAATWIDPRLEHR